jgi:hypothetical protein
LPGILEGGRGSHAETLSAPHGPLEVTAMSSRKPGTFGTRLARSGRWLGFDRNPLRRTADRIEAGIRIAMLILLIVAVPLTMIAVGRLADHIAMRNVRAQARSDHLVSAVLLQRAPSSGIPDLYSAVEVNWVPARWTAPGGSARTGDVLAPAGARKGSTVRAWVNVHGAITDPPPNHNDVVGDVFVAVTLTGLGLVFALLGTGTLARQALDRRRMSAWDTEWRAIGPLWSGHRS